MSVMFLLRKSDLFDGENIGMSFEESKFEAC